MKKLLQHIILFLLPVVLVLAVGELLLRAIPNEYKAKNDYMHAHASSIQVLLLGSSHSFYNVNPEFISLPAYNAAHSSQTLNYDRHLLEKFADSLTALKYLLLPVSYFSLYEKLDADVEAWRIKNYILYYGIYKTTRLPYYFETTSISPRKNLNKLINYYSKKEDPLKMNRLGYATSYSSTVKQNLEERGLIAARRDTKKDDRFFWENREHLESIIEWCRSKDIRVILFTPPAYISFRKSLQPLQQQRTAAAIKDIVQKYPGTIYLDHLADRNFMEADFYDADHLNEIGAKKFTLILNAVIDSLEREKISK